MNEWICTVCMYVCIYITIKTHQDFKFMYVCIVSVRIRYVCMCLLFSNIHVYIHTYIHS
jgi:hypothetical protein